VRISTRKFISISIVVLIAAIHAFRLGSYFNGNWYIIYYSYVSDLIIPFGFYFLLCISDIQIKVFRKWYIKAILVFGACTITEILQAFNITFLGETFDIIDIMMFAAGVMLAVIVDKWIFDRKITSWRLPG